MKKLLIAIFAVLMLAVTAFAASDPPQVGETSYYLLKKPVSDLLWTVTAKKDGVTWPGITGITTFINESSFAPGQYEAVVAWDEPGDYVLRFVPSDASAAVTYAVSIVNDSQASIYQAATAPAGLSFASISGIDARLASSHGTGLWSAAGSVNVLPFQGAVSYTSAAKDADVHVFRGDSVAMPYTLGTDLSGWEVWFGAKANPSDAGYAVGPHDITAYVADPAAGSGLINLTEADTDVSPRRYYAEIELRKSGEISTALRFFLWVDADVIR